MGFFFKKKNKVSNVSAVPTHSACDERMEYAIEFARLTVALPIGMLEEKQIDRFAVKVCLEEGGNKEHLWIKNVVANEDTITGIVDNEPEKLKKISAGQSICVKTNEISDWVCMLDGMIWGNFTLRAMLPFMPEDQRQQHASRLALMPYCDLDIMPD
jgi:uncharacterized protein YegJ (DUF2314 family)